MTDQSTQAEIEKSIVTITTTLVAAHKLDISTAADRAVKIIQEARERARRLVEEWRRTPGQSNPQSTGASREML